MVATMEIGNVVIVGTGLMGSQVAQVSLIWNLPLDPTAFQISAEAGIRVTLVGRTEEKCIQTRSKISAGISRSAKRKFANDPEAQQEYVTQALGNLEMRSDILDANLQDADLLLEAIVEDLKIKQSFFEKIEPLVSE